MYRKHYPGNVDRVSWEVAHRNFLVRAQNSPTVQLAGMMRDERGSGKTVVFLVEESSESANWWTSVENREVLKINSSSPIPCAGIGRGGVYCFSPREGAENTMDWRRPLWLFYYSIHTSLGGQHRVRLFHPESSIEVRHRDACS